MKWSQRTHHNHSFQQIQTQKAMLSSKYKNSRHALHASFSSPSPQMTLMAKSVKWGRWCHTICIQTWRWLPFIPNLQTHTTRNLQRITDYNGLVTFQQKPTNMFSRETTNQSFANPTFLWEEKSTLAWFSFSLSFCSPTLPQSNMWSASINLFNGAGIPVFFFGHIYLLQEQPAP